MTASIGQQQSNAYELFQNHHNAVMAIIPIITPILLVALAHLGVFPDADALWRHLHQLLIVDILQCIIQ